MIAAAPVRFELLSQQIQRCLKNFTDNAVKISSNLPLRMFSRGTDKNNNSRTNTWKTWRRHTLQWISAILGVAVIYLASELLIWGIFLVLRPVRLQFLNSILGMIMVFAFMAAVSHLCSGSDGIYNRNIKPKVDFINRNLGVGFPVPIVTISKEQLLGGQGIGRVVANFLNTNIIFWAFVFLLSWGILAGILKFPRFSEAAEPKQPWQPGVTDASSQRVETPSQTINRRASDTTTLNGTMMTGYHTDKEAGSCSDSRAASAYFTDSECPTSVPPPSAAGKQPARTTLSTLHHSDDCRTGQNAMANWFRECFPMVLAILFFIAIGIPISRITNDDRVLDGCMLWFLWISSTSLQRAFSRSHLLVNIPGLKTTVTTILNPVLLTTLTMTAYTRAKAAAQDEAMEHTLAMFSSGASLSDLWTYKTTGWSRSNTMKGYFGAGDAALSVLECGIVVWGFKLYECRRQIWSRAGAVVILISAGMAALNVFVSVLLGSAVGLEGPEALAFAGRSTTLALARPAMEALVGNQVVNATLVVSNGILGQLMYPFLLPRLGVEGPDDGEAEGREIETDDALTIAAGVAIGINGAAMGVSYLYERKSRAAPYAVLSMTVFGIMTVVFTALEPMRGTLVALAH
ncbi:uncharacterized protein GLRG_11118 [Colletotrichum graminicola M1.001]|uniref:LrgB-like family protein n=1 Tax=Colletotrichum graminicola (strain M1.001 / M2 / FGSC 10212) TaxID=645133 RepID=E3QYN6_COLGM|nr:uncharacterized protein GLRG_11118 [Colletotrichum graminicola M1.001]EFQ35974.1 hypothetical protein GLRG_11118 [Colletotrichum graminicola M1.001]